MSSSVVKRNHRLLKIVEHVLEKEDQYHWYIFNTLHQHDINKFDVKVAFEELLNQYSALYQIRRELDQPQLSNYTDSQSPLIYEPDFDESWEIPKQLQYNQFKLEYLKLQLICQTKYGFLSRKTSYDRKIWNSIKDTIVELTIKFIKNENIMLPDVSDFVLKQYL
jgi:hypothetical protein